MALKEYSPAIALDPTNPNQVSAGAEGDIVALDDLNTPLEIFDLSDVPITVLTSNDVGFIPGFKVDTHLLVYWKARAGGYLVLLESKKGLVEEITAAKQAAVDAAAAAAALGVAQDAAVASYVADPDSDTHAAVIAVAGSAGGGGTASNIVFIGPGDPVPAGTPDGAAVLTTLEGVP